MRLAKGLGINCLSSCALLYVLLTEPRNMLEKKKGGSMSESSRASQQSFVSKLAANS